MFGDHAIKSWSTNLAVIALSLGEAEYYSLVNAGGVSLGLEALTSELGIEFDSLIEISSDASAPIAISK